LSFGGHVGRLAQFQKHVDCLLSIVNGRLFCRLACEVVLPVSCRANGKREIIYSLRTKDRRIAARLALRAAVQLEDEFSLKRGEAICFGPALPMFATSAFITRRFCGPRRDQIG
jgi:hypothetical protein